jgi:hypothetical protein
MWLLKVYLVSAETEAPLVCKKYDTAHRAGTEASATVKQGTKISMYGGDLNVYYPAHKIDRVVVQKDDGQREEDWGHE